MGSYVSSAYSGRIRSVWDYLSDRGFTCIAYNDSTNMLVFSPKLSEWGNYISKGDYSTYDYQYTEGYNGFILDHKSLTPETFALYCLRDKKEITPYSWHSISYYYYYSVYGIIKVHKRAPKSA